MGQMGHKKWSEIQFKSDVEREMPSEEVYEYYEDDGNCEVVEVVSIEDENQELFDRLSDLLTRSVIELKGPPPPLTLWSWHDIPDQIKELKRENEALKAKVNEATGKEWEWPS